MRVGGWHHAPAASLPAMSWYPLCRRLGEPQGRSGRMRKISAPTGFDPRTSPYLVANTDYAMQAHSGNEMVNITFSLTRHEGVRVVEV